MPTKKTPTQRVGRPNVFADYVFYDDWLNSGVGKARWSEQNAARYRTTAEALLQQLHRAQRELAQLC
jgi:hypothetical protein